MKKNLSSRCKDFLVYCEIDFELKPCCDGGLNGLFNDRPLFTSHGVCFTSQYLLKPSVKSPLKFAMNVSKKYSTGTKNLNIIMTNSEFFLQYSTS